jgi:heterodisulfide reductase subunit A-like polyferredoxin
MSYDPQSHDAMFARILQRFDQQDAASATYRATIKADIDYIRAAVDKTNGRVNALEKWKEVVSAKVALVGSGAAVAVSLAIKYFLG